MIMLAALAAASGLVAYALTGVDGVTDALKSDLDLFAGMATRLLPALAIAAFVQTLVPRDLVGRWLGDAAGPKAAVLATLAGMATPGGPFLAFPLVLALKAAGANTQALITYLTAWSLLGVHRVVMWEVPLFGSRFALVRFLACLPAPILAGLITRALVARLKSIA